MAASRRILVADGDPDARARVVHALESPSHEVTPVADGRAALDFAQRAKPDLLVTEWQLPELSGLGLCRLLREDAGLGHLGVLMVTGLTDEIDRVLAFESGVDDFLAKPFFARELLSRATAVMRRSTPKREPAQGTATIEPALSLQANTRTVLVSGEPCDLTPREFHLLAALMREGGRVLSRSQMIHRVWGDDSDQDERVVDAHIKAIRRKLGAVGDCVETVRGVGYRYAEPGARLRSADSQ